MFQEYSTSQRASLPDRSLNGGLYTGEPFKEGAPYANVPVIPDTGYMIHYNLRSANPPEQALYHYPGTPRPGNNNGIFPGVDQVGNGRYGLACYKGPCVSLQDSKVCKCNKCIFSQYAYV